MLAKRAATSEARITSPTDLAPHARIGKGGSPLLKQTAVDRKEQKFIGDLFARRVAVQDFPAFQRLSYGLAITRD
jgi:hypothetical protein